MQLKGMKALKQLVSASRDNLSIIAVDFKAEMPIAEAMQLLNRRVAAAEAESKMDINRALCDYIG